MSTSKYRKFIAGAVVFVMIGMPIVSYMYLRQGLTFRMEALDALKVDASDQSLTKILSDKVSFVPSRVNALVDSRDIEGNRISDVYEKYKGNKYFHLLTYGTPDSLGTKHDQVLASSELEQVFEKHDMVLVDTSGQVRQSYKYSEEEFKTFIQELTVLLPIESSKKIKLDR